MHTCRRGSAGPVGQLVQTRRAPGVEHVKEDFSGLLPEEFITLSPPHEALDYHFGLEEGDKLEMGFGEDE